MKVVFLEDVARVAEAGEVKEVKPGFARNYLIPEKLAAPATEELLKRVANLKSNAAKKAAETEQAMKELGAKLAALIVGVPAKAGATDRLYGSVTNAEVAMHISKAAGVELDRRKVELTEGIRSLGVYEVVVRLHSGIAPTVKVVVHRPEETAEERAARVAAKASAEAEAKAAAEARAAAVQARAAAKASAAEEKTSAVEAEAVAPHVKAPKAKRKAKAEAATAKAESKGDSTEEASGQD